MDATWAQVCPSLLAPFSFSRSRLAWFCSPRRSPQSGAYLVGQGHRHPALLERYGPRREPPQQESAMKAALVLDQQLGFRACWQAVAVDVPGCAVPLH